MAAAAAALRIVLQVVYDLQRMTRMRRLPLPLHSVSEDGARGLAVNMQRLEAASPGLCDMLQHVRYARAASSTQPFAVLVGVLVVWAACTSNCPRTVLGASLQARVTLWHRAQRQRCTRSRAQRAMAFGRHTSFCPLHDQVASFATLTHRRPECTWTRTSRGHQHAHAGSTAGDMLRPHLPAACRWTCLLESLLCLSVCSSSSRQCYRAPRLVRSCTGMPRHASRAR